MSKTLERLKRHVDYLLGGFSPGIEMSPRSNCKITISDLCEIVRELEEARKDTERLDWLAYRWNPTSADSIESAILCAWGNDLRSAIDAAQEHGNAAKAKEQG